MTATLPLILQPKDWPRPSGYSNGLLTRGRQVFIAGQVGWNPRRNRFESTRLCDQVRQSLENVVAVLAEADGRQEHIVRMTWFLTSRDQYRAELKEIGKAYRTVMGRHFPPISAVQVAGLIEPEAQIEIEATAVIPDTTEVR